MDLSSKCINPLGMNMMMDDSDIKVEIQTNEDNVMFMCPVGNSADSQEKPARQTDLDTEKVQQDLQSTVKQEKIDAGSYGVNLTCRDTGKQAKTDSHREKITVKTEITSVPESTHKSHGSNIVNGKLKDALRNKIRNMKKLTGKNKVSKGCRKTKESNKKVNASDSRTSNNKLPEKYKRTANKTVTRKRNIRTGHEKQKRQENVLNDSSALKTSTGKFTCEQCNKNFCSQFSLNRHHRSVHLKIKQNRNGTKKYYCKQEGCDKVFSNGSNYKKHYDTVHLNIRRHLCEICSFMFKTKWALKTHLNTIHEKDQQKFRIFECKLCQKKFTSRGKLKIHETVHTDLKPFTCNFEDCGKTFRLKHNLTKHMNVHLCIKPYVCHICNQAFSRRMYLETHQYKHTGEKKYKCTVCEKRFTQQGNLNVHMKSHRNPEIDLNHSQNIINHSPDIINPLPDIINPSPDIINPSPNIINLSPNIINPTPDFTKQTNVLLT